MYDDCKFCNVYIYIHMFVMCVCMRIHSLYSVYNTQIHIFMYIYNVQTYIYLYISTYTYMYVYIYIYFLFIYTYIIIICKYNIYIIYTCYVGIPPRPSFSKAPNNFCLLRTETQYKRCQPGLKALERLWTSDGEGNPKI